MRRNFLLVLLILAPVTVALAAEDWELVPVTITTCRIDIGPHMTPGQYELAVLGVGPTQKSAMCPADKPLAIVPAGTDSAVIEPLKAKGWYVRRDGDPMICFWKPSTYTVDGVEIEVSLYEIYAKRVSRIGPCSTPTGMGIE